MTTEAHVFQHKFTGVQMFVYHTSDEITAKHKFSDVVLDVDLWIYLGLKQVIN